MSKIISILNEKGGVGKSTIAYNLAVRMLIDGLIVAGVDTDNQEHLFESLNKRMEKYGKKLENFLMTNTRTEKLLEDCKRKSERVIVDLAGYDSETMREVILKSDLIIIPLIPSPFDFKTSIRGMVGRIKEAQEIKSDLKYFFLLNKVDRRTKEYKEYKLAIQEMKLPLFKSSLSYLNGYITSIRRNQGVSETKEYRSKNNFETFYKELKEVIREEEKK